MSLEKFDTVADAHPHLRPEFQALRKILADASAAASLEPTILAVSTNLPIARLETALELLAEQVGVVHEDEHDEPAHATREGGQHHGDDGGEDRLLLLPHEEVADGAE